MTTTDLPDFTLREATPSDVPLILELIKGLAEYEKLLHEVVATEESLLDTLFGERRYAEVVIGFAGEVPVGFALFFHNFSTFLGKPGIYLEDLFIKPEYRGNGYGKCLLTHLAKLAVERNCGRLEWSVLDWNEPAIGFYKSLGADLMEGWSGFRLTGNSLNNLASS